MKKCTICKLEKEKENFNKNSSRKDGLSNVCRECNKNRSKKYYKDNHKIHRMNVSRRREGYRKELRKLINELKNRGCKYCNEKEICCLDFHHYRDNKLFNVSNGVGQLKSKETVLKEIEKYILVCSNCHRKIHAGLIKLDVNI